MNRLHKSVHKHLHLQHHRHTGKKLHHRHTSYHGLAVVLVLGGVLMLAVTALGHATADSFSVGGTVKAPVPSSAAIITSPSDGSKLTSDSEVVAGSCPLITPQVVVVIAVDDVNVGSAVCNDANDFSLPLRLAPGSHTIVAQAVTITGDPGPASAPVHISYAPSSTKVVGHVTSQPNGPVATPNPLVITPEGSLLWLGDDKTATWAGSISGGTPPYKVQIDWGDGTRQTFDQQVGSANFGHTYASLQPYNMSFSVIDTSQSALNEQFAVASFATSSASLAVLGSTTPKASNPFASSSSVLGLYGLYLTSIAVFGIIWLEAKHAAKEFVHAH